MSIIKRNKDKQYVPSFHLPLANLTLLIDSVIDVYCITLIENTCPFKIEVLSKYFQLIDTLIDKMTRSLI